MTYPGKTLTRVAASLAAGVLIAAGLPALQAEAAYTTWDVVWDQQSNTGAWGYAYKDKDCTSTGKRRVQLDNDHLYASGMKSIKAPHAYTDVIYNNPSVEFVLSYNTCWNLRGNNKIVAWLGYDPAKQSG